MADKSHNNHSGNGACHGRRRRRRRSSPMAAAINGVPETRAGLVARARQMVRDPGYPSEEMLWLIAQLLATRIERDPVSY